MCTEPMTSKAGKLHSADAEQPIDRDPVRMVYALGPAAADSKQYDGYVLGETRFESTPLTRCAEDVDHPLVRVPAPQLRLPLVTEYWLSPTPVDYRQQADVRYGANEAVLFGYTQLTLPSDGASLETAIRRRYAGLLGLLQSEGYTHMMRVWNYLPRIGDEIDGMECYRRFCRARHEAFESFYEELIPNLPATSVLGTTGADLQMVFMAGRSPAHHYENPRQVSAYHYPQEYGPKSPLFARATVVGWNRGNTVFISGTASIVGHKSQHRGDAGAQAQEILRNIEALIGHVANSVGKASPGLGGIRYLRVYLRNSSDLGTVSRIVERSLDAGAQAVYLQAAICRRELLVEMEALLTMEKPP